MDPCKYYSSSLNNDDVLVVRHTTKTIRALSSITGIEKYVVIYLDVTNSCFIFIESGRKNLVAIIFEQVEL